MSPARNTMIDRRQRRQRHGMLSGAAELRFRRPSEITQRFGLRGGDYVLFVGRLASGGAADLLIRAFRGVPDDVRLVVAGRFGTGEGHVPPHDESDPRVILPGYVDGDLLAELYTNAAAFVLPEDPDGLPLTLLDALSYGLPVVASAIPAHLAILGEGGPGRRVFRPGDEEALMYALRVTLRGLDQERQAAAAFRQNLLSGAVRPRVVPETARV